MSTFTPDEFRELEEAAEGRPLGSLMRDLVLAFLRRRRKK
jgi:hypothetical protein